MASSTDQPGPITKNVIDSAIILETISGQDKNDATSSPLPVKKYSSLLGHESLKGMKIALIKEYMLPEMRSDVKQLILDAAQKLRDLGAEVNEVSLMDPKYAIGVYTVLQRSEVSSNLSRFDGIRYGHERDVFCQETKRRIMLGTYTLSAGYYDAFYKKALAVRTEIITEFKKIFSEYDAVIGAVSPGPALLLGATKNQPMFGEMEDILVEQSSIAGLSSAGVPCGFVDGLPIGLQITADQFQEEKALLIADCFQKNTQHNLFPEIENLI